MSRGKKAIARYIRHLRRRGMSMRQWRDERRAKAFERRLKTGLVINPIEIDVDKLLADEVNLRNVRNHVAKTLRKEMGGFVGMRANESNRRAMASTTAAAMKTMYEQGVIDDYEIKQDDEDSEVVVKIRSRNDWLRLDLKT